MTVLYFVWVMNHYKSFPKLFFSFLIVGIFHNTICNWANFLAGWLIVMPNALCTKYGVDHIDIIAYRNGIIRAFGQAHIAVGTFVGNQ